MIIFWSRLYTSTQSYFFSTIKQKDWTNIKTIDVLNRFEAPPTANNNWTLIIIIIVFANSPFCKVIVGRIPIGDSAIEPLTYGRVVDGITISGVASFNGFILVSFGVTGD